MKLINIQVLRLKKDEYGYIPILRWLRHYQQEWSLPECLEWAKSLPRTLGPYTIIDAKKIKESLSSIAEISEETVTQKDNDPYKWGYHSDKPIDLLEAEAWFESLSQNDKNKINLLFVRYSSSDPCSLGPEKEDNAD